MGKVKRKTVYFDYFLYFPELMTLRTMEPPNIPIYATSGTLAPYNVDKYLT